MPKPVVASYCVTFLAPEMLHVYRQITGLQTFQPHVLTEKWIHRERFPFDPARIRLLPRARVRPLRRLLQKQILRGPIQISGRQVRSLHAALDSSRAALLHVYFGHIGLYLLPFLRACPVPFCTSFHGADAGIDRHRPRHRAALEELFHLADRILVRSEALGAELRALGCPPDKLRLNRTGIPMEQWPLVNRVPPETGAWTLLQACRLIEKKGLDLTLRAFAPFHHRYPASRLVIAGEGPLLANLRDLATHLDIADAVEFTGFLGEADLREVMRRADLFVHPSRTAADGNQEGVPNSMLEAMATGLPVVATRHGGIPEAIDDGESGLLVDEDDLAALTAALFRLAETPGLAAHFGEQGREAVQARFGQAAQVAALEAIYRELLSVRSG